MAFKRFFTVFAGFIFFLLMMPATTVSRQLPEKVRSFKKEDLEEFRKSSSFQYNQNLKPHQSWWDRFWHKFWTTINEFLQSTSYEGFWKYVIYIAIICVVVVAVLQLAKVDIAGLFKKQPQAAPAISFSSDIENIHEVNFEEQIQQALEQKQYRLAVRLQYLKALKTLADRQLIKWKSDKTNRSYLLELKPGPLRQSFDQLTLFFELAWYGEIPVNEAFFQKVREKYQDFDHIAATAV